MDATTEWDNISQSNVITPIDGTANQKYLAIPIGIISCITTFGNLLVIISFIRYKNLRSYGNYFILNLAFTDFIVGLLMAIFAPYTLSGTWSLGRVVCKIIVVLDYTVTIASSWNLALISCDRMISVVWPIKYKPKQNASRVKGLMTLPWLIGFLLCGPAILLWEPVVGYQKVPTGACYAPFYDNATFILVDKLFAFGVPFILVVAFNISLYNNIHARNQSMKLHQQTNQSNVQAALSRDRKTARSLAVLVIVYAITWLPYEVCAIIRSLCRPCIPGLLYELAFWLLWINSTINPVLYPLLQTKFRDAFYRILCCNRKQSIHPSSQIYSNATYTTT